ncbi:MAG: response regulator transcription factor [Dehalococcoidia bacterium]|nr:response regulator transcription factor [Dehalococcoidia bacterium]
MGKIFIVAAEPHPLTEAIRMAGHVALEATDLSQVIETLSQEEPDLVLLDLGLADERRARAFIGEVKEASGVPVIALVPAEQANSYDITIGADDFVLAPFKTPEVLARIRKNLWQTGTTGGQDTIRAGDLVIDLARYEVAVNTRRIILTFKEYQLLKFLSTHPGKVFTRDVLLNKVWGYDYYGGTRTVDVHVRRLRSKIEDRGHVFIETVRNVGYRFREEGRA